MNRDRSRWNPDYNCDFMNEPVTWVIFLLNLNYILHHN